MSMEEFNEFRKQLAASVQRLKQDVRRYPLFNADFSRLKPPHQLEEQENIKAEQWLGKKCQNTELTSNERCCVAMKFPFVWLRCNRRRSRKVLNPELQRVALLKKLNIGIANEDPHMGICLFHWRMIKYRRPGVAVTIEQLKSWEAKESRTEADDSSEDTSDAILAESSTSSDHEDSEDDTTMENGRQNTQRSKLNWRDMDIKQKKTKPPSNQGDEGDEHRDSEEDERVMEWLMDTISCESS
ncbi:unnamed protein product [Strongylus vulgaris]|uniref:Uncharacterized protein n=1 Tax=Strongylus vulgaris TaxID=40348 RepID=A0A3P7K284_STRVU|nr:unnamed protein product [Strongylus vulgaris]